jgi:hypothetical protein
VVLAVDLGEEVVDLGEEVAAEVGLVVGVGLEAVEAVESDTTKLYTLHACMHACNLI